MRDENTAPNGTTTKTATMDYDGEKKNGYGPIIVAVSLALLLGLSFYAGRRYPDADYLYSDGVGSGTAVSFSSGPGKVGPGESCTKDSDCLVPEGFDDPGVCEKVRCDHPYCGHVCSRMQEPGEACDNDSDCLVPKGFDRAFCEDRYYCVVYH